MSNLSQHKSKLFEHILNVLCEKLLRYCFFPSLSIFFSFYRACSFHVQNVLSSDVIPCIYCAFFCIFLKTHEYVCNPIFFFYLILPVYLWKSASLNLCVHLFIRKNQCCQLHFLKSIETHLIYLTVIIIATPAKNIFRNNKELAHEMREIFTLFLI